MAVGITLGEGVTEAKVRDACQRFISFAGIELSDYVDRLRVNASEALNHTERVMLEQGKGRVAEAILFQLDAGESIEKVGLRLMRKVVRTAQYANVATNDEMAKYDLHAAANLFEMWFLD
jgi:hypothetical protein